jgi:hypothetical protein
MLSTPSVALGADVGIATTLSLGQTLQIVGSSAAGTVTEVVGQTITVRGADASTTSKGVAAFNPEHFAVVTGTVSLAATLDDLVNVSSADSAATGSLLQKSAGDWVAASPSAVVGGAVLGDLSDVGTALPLANHVLVGNGTSFNTRRIYHLESIAVASTTWVVTHGIGQRYCNVTVVDSSNEVVIPQSIVFTDANSLTLTFNVAVSGHAVVMGLAP